MDWLMGAVLIFLVVVGLAIALVASKPPEEKRNKNPCVYCGTELRVVAGRTTPICQRCGRQQPGLEDQLTAHGRH
jgi:hypothetical protein